MTINTVTVIIETDAQFVKVTKVGERTTASLLAEAVKGAADTFQGEDLQPIAQAVHVATEPRHR